MKRDDIFEIALYLSGLSEDEYKDDDQLEQAIINKYNIEDMDSFHNIVDDLATLAHRATLISTNTNVSGFAKDHVFLYRKEI